MADRPLSINIRHPLLLKANDVAVLKQSQTEEMAMGNWRGEHLPGFVTQFLRSSK